MKTVYWNILSVLIGVFLLSVMSLIFSSGITELNTENFTQIAIPITTGIFGFVIMSWVKQFSWHKKATPAFVILAMISNVILFYLSISLQSVDKNYSISEMGDAVKSPVEIKDSLFHELISDIKPDVNLYGKSEKQLRKASKYFSYYYVFPVFSENENDSVNMFFACKTDNGMMGISLESYKNILTEGKRFIRKTNDSYYSTAIDSLKKENKLLISSDVIIFEIIDPERMKGFLYQYLWFSMAVFNGIYFILLLLFNLKLNNEKKIDFD